MADIQTTTFSENAASNNAATPDGWPENQSYASVNDCARELMGAIKREWNRSHPTLTAGGTANALTLTYTAAPPAYVRGLAFQFISGASANTGAATMNVNGLGAVSILRPDGVTALAGSEIPSSTLCEVVHNGTAFLLTLPQQTGIVTIANTTISGTPTWVEFALPTGFASFAFDLAALSPTANAIHVFQLSIDGGSTWLNGASEYGAAFSGSITPGFASAVANTFATVAVSTTASAFMRARMDLTPAPGGSGPSYYTATGSCLHNTTGQHEVFTYGGVGVQTATRPNRIRFGFNGTTFRNFGRITQFGIRP